MIRIDNKVYITEKEASSKFGYSIRWFRNRRDKKKSPPYIKIDNRVFYDVNELSEWFKKQMIRYE